MGAPRDLRTRHERRAATLAAIIVVQALCAAFFIGDVVIDLGVFSGPRRAHLWFETAAAIALGAGVIFLMIELRAVLLRMQMMDAGLRAAQGEMATVVAGFFDDWALTPAEREVALLILKGFDNEAISRLRGTAPGTVRAQSTRIYDKAGVDGRAQLLSVFMEELFADPVPPAEGIGIRV